MTSFIKTLKVIVIGDSKVGKTCLLKRLVRGEYNDGEAPTLGIENYRYELSPEKVAEYGAPAGQGLEFSLFDTSGNAKFQTMCTSRYRTADAFIVAFDIGDKRTFKSLGNDVLGSEGYLPDIKRFSNIPHALLIVGCKCDTDKREVTTEEGNALAQNTEVAAYYCEVSAKDKDGVEEAFQELARIWLEGPWAAGRTGASPRGGKSGHTGGGKCCILQ
eukprot:g1312.t1